MAAQDKQIDLSRRYTVQEYFRITRDCEGKYEYDNGRLIDMRAEAEAMAGGTFEHSLLIMNCGRHIGNALQGKPCVALDSNLRVRIGNKQKYRYPDVTVACGVPAFAPDDDDRITLLNPTLVLEVLSESSEKFDRGEKFAEYMQIESLREYVLIGQRRPRVEHYYRHDDGTWQFDFAEGTDAVAKLRSIDVELKLADVYAGVTFPPAEESAAV